MSSGLEFFSIDLDDVVLFLRDGDAAVLQGLLDAGADPMGPRESADENLTVWNDLARSLSGGKQGEYLSRWPPFESDGPREYVSRIRALLMEELIRQCGDSLGLVSHAAGSSAQFLREPFEYLDASGLLGPNKAVYLTDRPLFRQWYPSSPSWGGLTRQEIAQLQLAKIALADPDSGDTDVNSWVRDVMSALEYAAEWERDLVTLYD
jgi:hypothetical protein